MHWNPVTARLRNRGTNDFENETPCGLRSALNTQMHTHTHITNVKNTHTHEYVYRRECVSKICEKVFLNVRHFVSFKPEIRGKGADEIRNGKKLHLGYLGGGCTKRASIFLNNLSSFAATGAARSLRWMIFTFFSHEATCTIARRLLESFV